MNLTLTRPGAARKITAASSREALRLARKTIGEDVLVLGSRAVAEGMELVVMAPAAADELMQAARPLDPHRGEGEGVLAELSSLRSMLESRLDAVAWNDAQRRDPLRGRLLRTMLHAGFSPKTSQALLATLPQGQSFAEGMAFVRSELTRVTPVHQDEEGMFQRGGVYALVGPTGVGKTTTTAKLAARCVMRFGPDKLALVTTDGYRIGAYEQLRIYGQILGVPVHAVKDATNLQSVLEELQHKHMVLIDTVGMSQRDRAVADQIGMLGSAGRPVKRLLLLNAATHGDTLNEVVYAWQRAGAGNELAGCIFTKVDEATSRGALLDTVIRHRLPVYYLSNGQKVPEHLVVAERSQLVEEVLAEPPARPLFAWDPALATPADGDAEVAQVRAEAERLRRQSAQLIRAMAHDAEEIGTVAKHLESACVGFSDARRFWACACDGQLGPESTSASLLALARRETAALCDTHVLALCGRAKLDATAHGDTFDLQGCVLVSDRTGVPFAAPNQWLATGGDPRSAVRQLQWLRERDFGKPLVHLLPRVPTAEQLPLWTGGGRGMWLARAAASMSVVDAATGAATTLAHLKLEFGPPQPGLVRGDAGVCSLAETTVLLRGTDGLQMPVRCVARRSTCAAPGAQSELVYLLTNAEPGVAAARLAAWREWGSQVESCFRLTGKGVSLLGGMTELGSALMMKRLLIAGQVATTAWRVLHASGDDADRTRLLLSELAARQVRTGRPHSAAALYEGLCKLFGVLAALDTEYTQPGVHAWSAA